jgi:uncharacterized protein YecE (DUF72 family)
VIWIGTSGFQYPEWKGTFYPRDLSPKRMLEFYSERFNSTESNYTFRRMPSAKTLLDWANRTPGQFRFSLKAPQQITHIRRLRDCEEPVRWFCDVAQNLGNKLGPILFQLPPFARKDVSLLTDFLAVLPPGMKAAFEFRHDSWFSDDVFAALKTGKAALCIADSEKLTTPAVHTASFSYYRLRDEGYTDQDIARWAGQVKQQPDQVKETFVYFKHEEEGIGPKFAEMFREMVQRP